MSIYDTDPNDWVANDLDFDQTQANASLKEKYDDIEGFFNTGWIPADETWTFAADDDPTYTFTIAAFDATSKYSPGMRIKLTDSGTQYFIITKVVFDDPGSTITVFGGSVGDLSGGAITNPFFSVFKAPFGFSLNPDDWTIETKDTTERTQGTPGASTWYNLGAITIDIPIGIWNTEYQVAVRSDKTDTNTGEVYTTLSTANNSESDVDWTCYAFKVGTSTAMSLRVTFYRRKVIELATKDTYYLNTKVVLASDIFNENDDSPLIIRAICAYL